MYILGNLYENHIAERFCSNVSSKSICRWLIIRANGEYASQEMLHNLQEYLPRILKMLALLI